jgi:hypothetical protein
MNRRGRSPEGSDHDPGLSPDVLVESMIIRSLHTPFPRQDTFMKSIAAVVLAVSFSASSLAHAEEPDAPPPPAPPAAAPVAPPAAVPAPPPPPMRTVQSDPQFSWEEPPSSRGVGYLVTGGIFTGLGVLNLATSPLAQTDLVQIVSIAVGGTFLAIGVPLLIVGGVKRSKYNDWKANHSVAAGFGFSTANGGGSLTFKGQF